MRTERRCIGFARRIPFLQQACSLGACAIGFPGVQHKPRRQGLFQRAGRFLLNMAAGEGPARDKSVAFFLQIRLVPPDGFTLAATGFHPALLGRGLPSLNPRATTSR